MRENGILNNEDFFTSDELMEDWAPRQLTSSPPKSPGLRLKSSKDIIHGGFKVLNADLFT